MRTLASVALAVVFVFALTIAPAVAGSGAFTHTTSERNALDFVDQLEGTECQDAEKVHFTGTEHWVNHLSLDPHGGFHNAILHTMQGSGVGLVSVQQYVFNKKFSEKLEGDRDPHTGAAVAPFEHTFVWTWVLVAKGGAPNLKCQSTGHYTINANGDFAADFQHGDCTCGP